MKKLKKILALVIAMAMVLGMTSLSAFADVPTSGSITVNSPIIGAEYYAYKIFDMTTNEDVDAFSYTIKDDSPYYATVAAYANDKTNGLKLTATNSDEHTFNVAASVNAGDIEGYGKFDAQKFGKAIQEFIAANDAKEDTDTTKIALPVKTPTYTSGSAVTVDDAAAIKFNGLDLGYYLITNKYPEYNRETEISIPAYTDNDGNEVAEEKLKLTKDTADSAINAYIDDYVKSLTTNDKVDAYITENNLKVQKYGEGNESKWTAEDTADVKKQLEDTYRASITTQIETLMNKLRGDDSDYNVKEPVLIFVDSSQPDAIINEKNEIDKWDEPINPQGSADVEGLPEHGEPKGGKNIVIREADPSKNQPAIYGDWTEANIGDKVHYQLSINATNFERTGTGADSVEQIKEYIIADYQNANMEYSTTEGIKVSIVKKNAAGEVTDTIVDKADYSAWKDKFFLNANGYVPNSESDIFDADGDGKADKGGLVIPWVYEVKKTNGESDEAFADRLATIPNKYKTVNTIKDSNGNPVVLLDGSGNVVKDKDGNTVYQTETHYFASLYPNDVTILVDYYMVLKNTAVIDDPGNKNIAQYGVNFVDDSDTSYTPPTPNDDDKPSKTHEADDAKVYTYALAIHKVDNEGNDLSGAKFKIKGLTVTNAIAGTDGWYKVSKYDPESTAFGTELITDEKGYIVIEGLTTSADLEIQETEAPSGFNKLEGTVTTNATKISETVTTTETTKYYDADGNLTGSETSSTTKTTYFDENGNETNTAPTVQNPKQAIDVQANLKAVEFQIENNKGQELPSTGGIGTTIFYVIGTILVIGAGVVLITKRRMDA